MFFSEESFVFSILISKWKRDIPMDYFHLNNILIQND